MISEILYFFIFFFSSQYCFKNKNETHTAGLAKERQFPFFVQIEITQPHLPDTHLDKVTLKTCGGSLIEMKWILTNALCFYHGVSYNLTNLTQNDCLLAYIGTNKYLDVNADVIEIEEVLPHPAFKVDINKNGDVFNVRYDIALAKLKWYPSSKYIKPICLPDYKGYTNTVSSRCKCGTIIGIGGIIYNNTLNNYVHYANMCSKSGYYQLTKTIKPEIDNTEFLTEKIVKKQGPLVKEFGGPYVCQHQENAVQFGVLSTLIPVRNDTYVLIYEAVDRHMDFILVNVPNVKIHHLDKKSGNIGYTRVSDASSIITPQLLFYHVYYFLVFVLIKEL